VVSNGGSSKRFQCGRVVAPEAVTFDPPHRRRPMKRCGAGPPQAKDKYPVAR
jgi:hypothetical protein